MPIDVTPRPTVTARQILRIDAGKRTETTDSLASEYPLTIFLNGQEIVTTLCTPEYLDELALGFLRSEGFVRSSEGVTGIRVDLDRGLVEVEAGGGVSSLTEKLYGKRTISSGCGRGTVFYQASDSLQVRPVASDLRVPAESLSALMRELQRKEGLYKETGAVHCAALADTDRILFFREDIGRHNAVDKVVGACFREGIPTENKLILVTGRVSSEMLLKAAKLGIPLVASRSAPTDLAVRMAEELRVTLVGFARGDRMNVYSEAYRVG